MIRFLAGIGTVVAALAFVPAVSACEEPSKAGERERVAGEAGGKVDLDVPNTLEGARWELRIEDGDELADGIDEDPEEEGVTVRFEVPDLGVEPGEVDLVIDVTHEADGADWSYEVALDYRGRPAPEPVEEPEPQPQSQQPAPPPEPPRQEPPPPEPQRQADSQAAPASVSPPPPPAPPAAAPAEPLQASSSPDRLQMTPGASASAPPAAAPVPTTVGLATPPAAAPAPAAPAERAARSARRRHVVPRPAEPAPAEPRQPPPADAPEGGVRLPDVHLPGFGAGLAWTVIVVGALSFAAMGLALGGIARHRRRRRLVLR